MSSMNWCWQEGGLRLHGQARAPADPLAERYRRVPAQGFCPDQPGVDGCAGSGAFARRRRSIDKRCASTAYTLDEPQALDDLNRRSPGYEPGEITTSLPRATKAGSAVLGRGVAGHRSGSGVSPGGIRELMKPVGFEPTTSLAGALYHAELRSLPTLSGQGRVPYILTMVIYQRYSLHPMNFIFTR